MVRGRQINVTRIPYGQGYVWEGYWMEDPNGEVTAIPVGRIRKVYRVGGLYSANAIWLDIGGYMVL
jgi:hypothetical protein